MKKLIIIALAIIGMACEKQEIVPKVETDNYITLSAATKGHFYVKITLDQEIIHESFNDSNFILEDIPVEPGQVLTLESEKISNLECLEFKIKALYNGKNIFYPETYQTIFYDKSYQLNYNIPNNG